MSIESTAPSSLFDEKQKTTLPMREELVQMAVKFLSHDTVRNSSVVSRLFFLEKKGLTADEIDEAFRRVPDLPSIDTVGQSLPSTQDIQPNSVLNIQLLATTQSMATHPTEVISTLAMSPPSRFSWSYALFVVGLLTASFAGTIVLAKVEVLDS